MVRSSSWSRGDPTRESHRHGTVSRPMILDRYPLPSRGDEVGQRAIGYWRSDEHPSLPDPHDFVDPSWDASERAAVVAYVRIGEIHANWGGISICRFEEDH